MKKIYFAVLFLFMSILTFSQGLENIIVEKYYKASAADAALDGSDPKMLAEGAVTYRIYVDMAPGYKFQAAYGVAAHELFLQTSTRFFNENNRGAGLAEAIQASRVDDEMVALDSWLSVGAASAGHLGVLKNSTDDTNGSILVNQTNNAPGIGPLNVIDGLISGTQPVSTTLVGEITDSWFGTSAGLTGPRLSTFNGSWAALGGGVEGPVDNRVLIAQITTDGDFSFELNIQLGTPTLGVERYVAKNPTGAEQMFPGLTYSSLEANIAPEATITFPITDVFAGQSINVTVGVADANQDPALQEIDRVEFRVDGGAILSDDSSPYSFPWNTGSIRDGVVLEARAINTAGMLEGPWDTVTVDVVRMPVPPSVTLSANDVEVMLGDVIIFTAAAVVAPDLTPSYVFNINNVEQTPQASGTFSWTSDAIGGTIPVSVTVSNIDGTATASMTVKVISNLAEYEIVTNSENCNLGDRFCLPVRKIGTPLADVTGFDFTVIYDATKVRPTRQIDVMSNAGGANNNNTAYTTNVVGDKAGNDTMYVSLYLDGNSIAADGWDGTDIAVFCIEFAKVSTGFGPEGSASFSIADMIESTVSGISDVRVVVDGTYSTFTDNTYTGYVKFWSDNQPMFGVSPVATRLQIGLNAGTTTDINGRFNASFGDGSNMTMWIEKEVDNNASALVLPGLYSGYDAFRTAQYTTNMSAFTPTAQQVIAMDVNRDTKVSAGDISQINQRSVKTINEFSGGKDWVFYNENAPFNDPTWVGFSKNSVPSIPTGFDLADLTNPVIVNPTTCPAIVDGNNTYYGIALGDVDGSWADVATDNTLKSASVSEDQVIFDLTNAYTVGEYVDVPLMVLSESGVNALNFVVELNANANVQSVSNRTDYIEFNSNVDGQYYAISSYSVSKKFEVGKPLLYLHIYAPQGIVANDVLQSAAWVNGKKATVALQSNIKVDAAVNLRIYPNPVSHLLNVEVPEESTIQLFDMSGKSLFLKAKVNGTEVIDVKGLASGIYTLKVSNNNYNTVRQIAVTK